MEHELSRSLCRVRSGNGSVSYGGSQMLARDETMRGYGCGIVATAELAIYLSRRTASGGRLLLGDIPMQEAVDAEAYNSLLNRIRRQYVPIIPRLGVNGFAMAAGVNMLFRRNAFPFSCRWCFWGGELYERIAEMLDEDIPVIMSVGPNFPNILGKRTLRLMAQVGPGDFRENGSARAHYVIVTGLDRERMRISSWGREYYIDRSEYDFYVKHSSSSLVSNVLYVKGTVR